MNLKDRIARTIGRPDPTEPTTCTCATPNPDGLGECRTCRRLVVEGES